MRAEAMAGTEQIVHLVRNQADYERYMAVEGAGQAETDAACSEAAIGMNEWMLEGRCEVCGGSAHFLCDWRYSDNSGPNYRERLVCARCGLNNRQRFCMSRLREEIGRRRRLPVRLYLYEQTTRFFALAGRLFPQAEVIGSEYLGCDKKGGEVIGGLRHEDAMALSFADESLDVLFANDVWEHVPDYMAAFRECVRVLTPGGCLYFSIPFLRSAAHSSSRALLENGQIRHLKFAQYHYTANPADPGCLVFHDFGWDILDACQQAGFADAHVIVGYSLEHAYLGQGGQMLFKAEKGFNPGGGRDQL